MAGELEVRMEVQTLAPDLEMPNLEHLQLSSLSDSKSWTVLGKGAFGLVHKARSEDAVESGLGDFTEYSHLFQIALIFH